MSFTFTRIEPVRDERDYAARMDYIESIGGMETFTRPDYLLPFLGNDFYNNLRERVIQLLERQYKFKYNSAPGELRDYVNALVDDIILQAQNYYERNLKTVVGGDIEDFIVNNLVGCEYVVNIKDWVCRTDVKRLRDIAFKTFDLAIRDALKRDFGDELNLLQMYVEEYLGAA